MLKRITQVLTALALSTTLFSSVAVAQVELGSDAALTFMLVSDFNGVDQDNVLNVGIPLQFFRAGFFVNEQWSIEPGVGYDFTDVGDFSEHNLLASLAVLYNLAGGGPLGFFAGASGLLSYTRSDTGTTEASSASQFGVGASVGLRGPIVGDVLKYRSEFRYAYLFESASDFLPSASMVMLTFGLSAFIQ